jgi:hypothetical protein
MSKILKDPTKVKTKTAQGGPWNFLMPTKDQAHSGNLCAGNNYGIGHRQPIGKESAAPITSGPIPQESRCFSPDEIFDGEDQRG